MRNDPYKAHFEGDAIIYKAHMRNDPYKVQNMHSQEVMNLDIIGHFENSTKTPFGNLNGFIS